MDNNTGIQIPAGLLPAVTEFNPGELVAFFIHPHADRDTVAAFIDNVKRFASAADICDATAHLAPGPDVKPIDAERLQLRRCREAGFDAGQVTVFFHKYQPRFTAVELEVDVSFHILPGAHGIHVELGKLRRPNPVSGNRVLSFPLHQTLKPAQISIDVENSIVLEVVGRRPRDGKTTVAYTVAALLRAALQGTGKTVELVGAELGPHPAREILTSPKLDLEFIRNLDVEKIVIVDGNRNFKQWRSPPATDTISLRDAISTTKGSP